MKKIAFHDNNLSLRGTSVALFDYADYNERILGNESIIISSPNADLAAYDKFINRFGREKVILMDFYDYHTQLPKIGVDYLYIIKSGGRSDGLCSEYIPTLIHAVFRFNEPHGHRYRYVSDWLASDQGYNPAEYSVPHIVKRLPEPNYNLREKLGIGLNKTVFGCLGGSTEFNHRDAREIVERVSKERDDILFIFMNIDEFANENKNIIHLPGTWDMFEKSSFIMACDAMIHARSGGETFGCAVAEFSIMNKPVVTYGLSGEKAHLDMLGERAIIYNTYDELYDIINNLKQYIKYDDYYKAYDNCTPDKIMQIFDKNFLT